MARRPGKEAIWAAPSRMAGSVGPTPAEGKERAGARGAEGGRQVQDLEGLVEARRGTLGTSGSRSNGSTPSRGRCLDSSPAKRGRRSRIPFEYASCPAACQVVSRRVSSCRRSQCSRNASRALAQSPTAPWLRGDRRWPPPLRKKSLQDPEAPGLCDREPEIFSG